ncbi:MAG: polyprenyl synthetase family protein [Coriobacteriales bacterium]|jgi:geranylgeranyl diphosphate synthase type I|nr:polyprenyl synthetase family protein [Coriobacteriales bacterium]
MTDTAQKTASPPAAFEDYLNARAERMNTLVASYFSGVAQGSTADMKRYLYEPLAAYSANGGKRHRPLICTLACEAVGGDPDRAAAAAAAIEHFHTAALIHDDIADESLLRRGEPCMHLTQGEGLAINAGDLALSQVTGLVVEDMSLSDAIKLRVLDELVQMTQRTIEGQALDIGWARDGRFDIRVEDYLIMATHKTAYYSGATPLAVGAIIGGGNETQIEALRSFGLSSGLAFQIQDDLLNLIGTKESTKKDFRSDITEGKRTLIAVHAIQHSERSDELVELLSTHVSAVDDLARVVALMDAAGSLAFAHDYAIKLVNKAKSELSEVLLASRARELLLTMADYFIARMS